MHSVASFFVSRVNAEVNRRLDAIGTGEARSLRGRAAVAQARLAYRLFRSRFSGERWDALAAAGAHPQRPLWASTSTKNAAYPDTLYIDNLIGPDTVNTLPEAAIAAFEDHGRVARTIDTGVTGAAEVIEQLGWASTWTTSATPLRSRAWRASMIRSPTCSRRWRRRPAISRKADGGGPGRLGAVRPCRYAHTHRHHDGGTAGWPLANRYATPRMAFES